MNNAMRIRLEGTAWAMLAAAAQIALPSPSAAYQLAAEAACAGGSCAVPLTSAGFALCDAAGQGGTIGTGAGAGGLAAFEGIVYLLDDARDGGRARYTFTVRSTACGSENWVSLPVKGSGLTDTFSLGRSIAAVWPAAPGDALLIETWDNGTKLSRVTRGELVDTASGPVWEWADDQPLAAGAMLKVLPLRPAGTPAFSVDWSVEGDEPRLSEATMRISQCGGGNENRIVIPPSLSGVSDTFALGRSIAAAFAAVPGDSILIETWDNATQTSRTTSGDFVPSAGGGEWRWDADTPLQAGEPVVVYLSHYTEAAAFEISWP